MFDNATAMVASHARGRPEHAALVQGDRRLSYGELEQALRITAGRLERAGAQPGQIVGLMMGNTIDHFVCMLALLRLGCTVMPMDVRWTRQESGRVLEFFKAPVLLTDAAGEPPQPPGTRVIHAAQLAGISGARPVASWSTTPDTPAFLSLTSGTTGVPKGALLTHGLYLTRLMCEAITLGSHPDDVNVCATPLYFGAGRNITLTKLFVGATVALFPPPYEPAELVEAVRRCRGNSMYLVPTLIRRLLPLASEGRYLFETLEVLMCGGAILRPEEWADARRLLAPSILNVYGTSEAGLISYLPPGADPRYAESVGRAAFMTEFEVVDEDDRPLPQGGIGRIRYRSPQVPEGYYNDPKETAAAFRNGWYYPGDAGRIDAEGYLYIVGRTKDMIIRGGVNIYPAEIESVLMQNPAVVEASVVGWPSREFGEEVAAFVIRRGGVEESDLIEHCRASLARYKVPRRVFFVEEFPRTSAGKVLKARLAEALPLSN